MRKAVYLLAIMFSLVLASTSCEKGDEVTPEEEVPSGIQPSDIVGSWGFVSLVFEFNGTTTTYTDCDTELNRDYDGVTLGIDNVTTTNMTLYTNCIDQNEKPWRVDYGYTIKDNVITTDNTYPFKYQIVNATTFDGTVLKLKLIDQGGNTTLPLNGTYTLEKL